MLTGSYISETLGLNGSTYITDTATHTGTFGIIQALSDTVISALVSATFTDGTAVMTGTLAAISLPAGVSLYGSFTSVKLTSGVVVAYNLKR